MLVGSYDHVEQLQLWSVEDGAKLHTETYTGNATPCMVYCAQYSKSPAGSFFALGGAGGNEVRFYKTEGLQNFAVVQDLSNAAFGLDWAWTDLKCAVGCGDGGVRVFRISRSED